MGKILMAETPDRAKTDITAASAPGDYAAFRQVLNRYSGFLLSAGYVPVPEVKLTESSIALAARYLAPEAAALLVRSGELSIGIVGLRRVDAARVEVQTIEDVSLGPTTAPRVVSKPRR